MGEVGHIGGSTTTWHVGVVVVMASVRDQSTATVTGAAGVTGVVLGARRKHSHAASQPMGHPDIGEEKRKESIHRNTTQMFGATRSS